MGFSGSATHSVQWRSPPTSRTFTSVEAAQTPLTVKGHGNEADFLGFLQKLVPHESFTLPFEPFRF
jgi:hypothetical protein